MVHQPRPLTGANTPVAQVDRGFLRRSLPYSRWIGVALDATLAFTAFWVAWLLRYHYEVGGQVMSWDWRSFDDFSGRALLFAALVPILLGLRQVYTPGRWISLFDQGVAVIGGTTTAMAVVILTAFLGRFVPSRLVFLYAWLLAIFLLLFWRAIGRQVQEALWSRDIGVQRVLVVGAGEAGRRIIQTMMGTPSLGYRVAGYLGDGDELPFGGENGIGRVGRLGANADLQAVVRRHDIDEVIIALPAWEQEALVGAIEDCQEQGVTFKVVPDLLQLSLDRVDLSEVSGIPLIGLKDHSLNTAQTLVKRSSDLLVAVPVLVVAAIPMAIIALLIRRDSPGPVIFRQQRVGRDGEPFTLLKFRCMEDGADERRAALIDEVGADDPRLFKHPDDPRVTPIGRRLRRWSLDELPQFFNVLVGDMAVVGPRPQLPEEVAGYEEWHRQRLLVAPGLTGLWQVNGRSNLTFDEMVRLDLFYAENWSPWLDLKIVLKTIPAVLTGRGAF